MGLILKTVYSSRFKFLKLREVFKPKKAQSLLIGLFRYKRNIVN